MSMFKHCCYLGLLVLTLFSTVHGQDQGNNQTADSSEPQFISWLPEFRRDLQNTLVQDCSDKYQEYAAAGGATWDNIEGMKNVISCILSSTPEWRKSNMASAAVMLGLIPTILGLTGSHVAEVMLIGMFRPALAFLINYGAPVLNPSPTLSGIDPLEFLQPRKKGRAIKLPHWLPLSVVVVVEHMIALAAVGNFVCAIVQLDDGTLVSFAIREPLLLVWWITALLVFSTGQWALERRVHSYSLVDTKAGKSRFARFWHWLKKSVTQAPGKDMAITLKTGTTTFAMLSFFNTVCTAGHILFGTVVFSSLLFIGVRDATIFAFRILISHLACRAIVMFEMSRLRATVKVDYGDEEEQLGKGAQTIDLQDNKPVSKSGVHVQTTTDDDKSA